MVVLDEGGLAVLRDGVGRIGPGFVILDVVVLRFKCRALMLCRTRSDFAHCGYVDLRGSIGAGWLKTATT